MKKQRTRAELIKEIERVECALQKTKSEHLKSDYMKYLKRLKKEYKRGGDMVGNRNRKDRRDKAV